MNDNIKSEEIVLFDEIATKTNTATIKMFNKKIIISHIVGGIGLCAILLLTFLLWGILHSAVFFIPLFAVPLLAIYYFSSIKCYTTARNEYLRRISNGKLLYAQYVAIEKVNRANNEGDTTQSIESTEKNENAIYEIKRIARINLILGISCWIPILLIIILFALPLISIDITLGEIVIERYNVSVFDFVFSHSNNETFKEELLAEITAEFIGVESENYNNFFSIFYAFGNNIEGSVNGFGDVLNIFKGMIFDFALPIGSIIAIVFYTIAALVCIFKYIKRGMVETALRRVDNNTFIRVFNYSSAGNTRRSFSYCGKMTSYIVKFLIGYFIAVFFFSYLPMQLVLFLDNYALVAVNSLWYFAFWSLLILHIVFLIVGYVFSIKKATVLNGCDYINSIK